MRGTEITGFFGLLCGHSPDAVRKAAAFPHKPFFSSGRRKKTLLPSSGGRVFTLTEQLLVVTSQLGRNFFKRFFCTDKYGCVRKYTESATPRGCEVAKLVFCSEDVKTAAVPPCLSRRNLLAVKSDEVPLTGCGCVNGCVLGQTSKFAQSQNTPLFFESERGFGGKRKPSFLVKRKFSLSPNAISPFTLIELVVTISIIVLTVSLVVAVFRKESPARALENMELDFRSYCARVRYRACETGRDWVINFDPETKVFSAAPGKHEKFQMPGQDGQGLSANEVVYEEEPGEEEFDYEDPENSYGRRSQYAKLEWRLPENIEFTTEKGDEDSLMTGELLEIFRFFPDGGGSGSGYLDFKCGELNRIFKITKLTGRLLVQDKEEYERGLQQ